MSIYEFLKEKNTENTASDSCSLPDSGDLCLRAGEAWVPGAFEGTILRTDIRIKQHLLMNYRIAGAVRKQALQPSEARLAKLEKLLSKYSAISLVDPLCSICVALGLVSSPEKKEALRRLAMELALRGEKREPVKVGIALLGICGTPDDAERIKPLGLHNEFTLYAAGTAVRLLQPPARGAYLLELAERVQGWGKIAVLYELDYSDPAACLWAIKHGCENTVGLSYLSNVCATKGKLADVRLLGRQAENIAEPAVRLFFRHDPGIPQLGKCLMRLDPFMPQVPVCQRAFWDERPFMYPYIGIACRIARTHIQVLLDSVFAVHIGSIPQHGRMAAVGAFDGFLSGLHLSTSGRIHGYLFGRPSYSAQYRVFSRFFELFTKN